MKRLAPICLVLLMLTRILSPSIAENDEESDAPYMYYYSDILNGFVIERADGSDSRIFGDGLMPENTDILIGPGWSPSGEWFAWTANNDSYTGDSAFVLNVDGHRRLEFLDDFIDAQLAWSPVDDRLMFTGVRDDPSNCNDNFECTVTMQIGMIDPNTERMIVSIETPRTVTIRQTDGASNYYYNSAMPTITWLDDGQYAVLQSVAISNFDTLPITEYDEVIFRVFGIDGLHFERSYTFDTTILWGDVVSSTGNIAYRIDEEGRAVVENLLTGEQREFRLPNAGLSTRIHWRVDGETALISAHLDECVGFYDCGYSLWILPPNSSTLQLITEDFYNSSHYRPYPSWSPDGRFALYAAGDEVLHVLNLDEVVTNQLDFVGDVSRWEWLDSTRLLIASSKSNMYYVHEYDIQTDTILNEVSHDNHNFMYGSRFSPDGRSFAFLPDGLAIVDVDTGQSRNIRPDGRSYWSNPAGDVIWHESGDWIIRAEEGSVSSGGGGLRLTGIVNVDGSIHRDLGYCWASPLCIDWLPDRVDPINLSAGQSSSVLPEPDDMIHRATWSFFMSWSPDSQRIVAGHDLYREDNETAFYDVETHETIPSVEVIEIGQTVHWELQSDGEYLPDAEGPADGFVLDNVLATSPDDTIEVAYTESPFELAVYEVSTGNLIFDLNNYGIATASFSPDGEMLAVSGAFGRTQLFDTTNWQILVTLNTNGTALAFSPDGQTLAVGSSWDIQLWDVEELHARSN